MASTDMEDLHGLVLTQVGGVLVLVMVVVMVVVVVAVAVVVVVVVNIGVFWCDILCSACCDL